MLNEHRHFYLYAKGHYKEDNIITDIAKLQADYCGLIDYKPAELFAYGVFHLIEIVIPHMKKEVHAKTIFNNLLDDNLWRIGAKVEDSMHIKYAKASLSLLAFLKVSEIDGELGEPNPKILPLSNNALLVKKQKSLKPEYRQCETKI
jgi:hypothetical protein